MASPLIPESLKPVDDVISTTSNEMKIIQIVPDLLADVHPPNLSTSFISSLALEEYINTLVADPVIPEESENLDESEGNVFSTI